nr:hypothetical protein [Tanacetum cinerariifolium]
MVTTPESSYTTLQRLGEMRIDLTMLEEEKDIDALLVNLVEDMDEVGKIPPISSYAPPPVYHPLSPKQKEKILEALDRKYKELEEKKPIVEVLKNYMTYRKKLDEVMMGRAILKDKGFPDEEIEMLIENSLPNKMCDLGDFVLVVRLNGTT